MVMFRFCSLNQKGHRLRGPQAPPLGLPSYLSCLGHSSSAPEPTPASLGLDPAAPSAPGQGSLTGRRPGWKEQTELSL